MTTPTPPVPRETHWPSGVGGAQCDNCGEFTIVRHFGNYDEPDGEWLCLPCWRGDDDMDDEDDEEPTNA